MGLGIAESLLYFNALDKYPTLAAHFNLPYKPFDNRQSLINLRFDGGGDRKQLRGYRKTLAKHTSSTSVEAYLRAKDFKTGKYCDVAVKWKGSINEAIRVSKFNLKFDTWLFEQGASYGILRRQYNETNTTFDVSPADSISMQNIERDLQVWLLGTEGVRKLGH